MLHPVPGVELFYIPIAMRTEKERKIFMVKISLKGDVVKEFDQGTTVAQIAAALGAGLAKAACAAKIDGKVCDLRTPVLADCSVEILQKGILAHRFPHSGTGRSATVSRGKVCYRPCGG